jgi:hypothetical protein
MFVLQDKPLTRSAEPVAPSRLAVALAKEEALAKAEFFTEPKNVCIAK